MFYKLLNGDILEIDEPQGGRKVNEIIAGVLNVQPYHILIVDGNKGINENKESEEHKYVFIHPNGVIDLREFHAFDTFDEFRSVRGYAVSFPEDVGDNDDANVDRLLADVHHFCSITGFCTNSNDRIVEWLFAHPEHISYPQFLGNKNPRAVEHACEWLSRRYAKMEDVFNTNPELMELYVSYLYMNTNPDMFWYVWHNCPYLRPWTQAEIVRWAGRIGEITILK